MKPGLAIFCCSPWPLPPRADFPEAKARGKLEVLFVPGSPEFADPEKHTGFDMEILEGFARLHRLEVIWVPVKSWDQLLPTLNAGQGDLAAGGITVTPVRQKACASPPRSFRADT